MLAQNLKLNDKNWVSVAAFHSVLNELLKKE